MKSRIECLKNKIDIQVEKKKILRKKLKNTKNIFINKGHSRDSYYRYISRKIFKRSDGWGLYTTFLNIIRTTPKKWMSKNKIKEILEKDMQKIIKFEINYCNSEIRELKCLIKNLEEKEFKDKIKEKEENKIIKLLNLKSIAINIDKYHILKYKLLDYKHGFIIKIFKENNIIGSVCVTFYKESESPEFYIDVFEYVDDIFLTFDKIQKHLNNIIDERFKKQLFKIKGEDK